MVMSVGDGRVQVFPLFYYYYNSPSSVPQIENRMCYISTASHVHNTQWVDMEMYRNEQRD